MKSPAPAASARLRDIRVRAGLSIKKMADELGLSKSTYEYYETDYKKPYLPPEVVQALRCSVTGMGDPAIQDAEIVALSAADFHTRADTSSRSLPTVTVTELDVRAAAGDGVLTEEVHRESAHWQLPRDLIKGQTSAPPSALRIITVTGDSNAPDFHPGQKVLVDTEDRVPSPPGFFVLYDGLGLVLKQLEIVPYSDPLRVRIKSRNPAYETYEMPLETVVINGRVLGRWQWT